MTDLIAHPRYKFILSVAVTSAMVLTPVYTTLAADVGVNGSLNSSTGSSANGGVLADRATANGSASARTNTVINRVPSTPVASFQGSGDVRSDIVTQPDVGVNSGVGVTTGNSGANVIGGVGTNGGARVGPMGGNIGASSGASGAAGGTGVSGGVGAGAGGAGAARR